MLRDNEIAFLGQMALGVFEIDEEGRIWRLKWWRAGSHYGKPATLRNLPYAVRAERASHKRGGRLKVMFTVAGKRWAIYAHRAVWIVSMGKAILDGHEINHDNGKPQDNRSANLGAMTRQQNTAHAGAVLHVLGTKPQRGEMNAGAKLTDALVREIRLLWKTGVVTQQELAKRHGVAQTTISDVVLRRTWTHLDQVFLG